MREHQRRWEACRHVLDSFCPVCKADFRSQHLEVGAKRCVLAWKSGTLVPFSDVQGKLPVETESQSALRSGSDAMRFRLEAAGSHRSHRTQWRLLTSWTASTGGSASEKDAAGPPMMRSEQRRRRLSAIPPCAGMLIGLVLLFHLDGLLTW